MELFEIFSKLIQRSFKINNRAIVSSDFRHILLFNIRVPKFIQHLRLKFNR